MSQKKLIFTILCAAFLLGAGACSFPSLSSPTPFVIPTANLTMTALFRPTETIPPTATPPIIQTATSPAVSPTAIASATPLPETSTTSPDVSPTVSATAAPGTRGGVSIPAVFLSTAPTIDGDLGEWTLAAYPVDKVVYGAANHTGASDLSGTLMVGWDDDNLYIGARVRDAQYVQIAQGINLFKGDSVEILLDTKVSVDFFVRNLSPDDYQLGISPGSPQPGSGREAYLWYPRGISGTRSQVVIGAQATDTGYTVEAAIPWSVFEVSPVSGTHFGFAFSISDNDLTASAVQQSMVSTISTRRLTDPTTWGDLTLMQP